MQTAAIPFWFCGSQKSGIWLRSAHTLQTAIHSVVSVLIKKIAVTKFMQCSFCFYCLFFCERCGGKGGEGEGEGFPADSQPIPGNDQIETRTVEIRTAVFAEGQMLCMQNL